MNIQDHCLNNNFYFDDDTLFNFHCSLQTKPFIILYGPSGTGKSKIAELYSDYICKSQGINSSEHLCFIAVRPNWTSPSDLMGFYDYLNNEFIPSKLFQFMEKAASDQNHPYFVILDEMNLSIVEHYFSDFLACLETRRHVNSADDLITWESRSIQGKYSTLSQASIMAYFDLVNKGDLAIHSEFDLEKIRSHEIVKHWKSAHFNGQESSWTPQFRTEFNQKDADGNNSRLAGKFFESVRNGVYRVRQEKKFHFNELSTDIIKELIKNSSYIEQENLEIYKNKSGVVTMPIPLNLYFVGTINMDESTHPLSSKVLDRANTIEINNVSRDILNRQSNQVGMLKVDEISPNFSSVNSLANLNSAKRLNEKLPSLIDLIYSINDGLVPYRKNMGHRSIFEIAHYINLYTDITNDIGLADEALDLQICQKLIPKLIGADERVEQSIFHTVKVLTDDHVYDGDSLLNMDASIYTYPRALGKLQRMYKYYIQNGFVNFANV